MNFYTYFKSLDSTKCTCFLDTLVVEEDEDKEILDFFRIPEDTYLYLEC